MSPKLPGTTPVLPLTLYLILTYKRYNRASCNSAQSCVLWMRVNSSLYRLQMTVILMGIVGNAPQLPLGSDQERTCGRWRWTAVERVRPNWLVRPNPKSVLPASPLAGRLLNGPPITCTMFWPNSKWFLLTYGVSNLCKRVLDVQRCILSHDGCVFSSNYLHTHISPTLVEMISNNPYH
jgi:hypothetical protein